MAKKYLDYSGLLYLWGKIKVKIPSKTSDLVNDSGFIDSSAVPTNLSDLTNDMAVSDFTNDAGYLTQHQDISGKADKTEVEAVKVVKATASSVSSLPKTISNSKITSDMVLVNSVLSNPAAQTSEWTVTTYNGSVKVSGTISGTTDIELYLIKQQ